MGLEKLEKALVSTVSDFLVRRLPLRRILLVGSLLKHCQVELLEKQTLTERILSEQKSDGGWIDCEDTAWALYYLSCETECNNLIAKGIKWLDTERCENSGWGFCKRDESCIPITAQILFFIRNIPHCAEAASWLEKEWENDLASPINLNYKASWYLLCYFALRSQPFSRDLFHETVDYLLREQRDDGSWGPWRCHPAPSECFITGICLGALAYSYELTKHGAIISALNRGIGWVTKKQLDNGLFPTHYIDEGSAWIFFGWKNAQETISAYINESFIDREVSPDAGRDIS